ncbi:MAG: hypothetical protein HKN43_07690 [Rhodothermales bacterium]|nr:hypothetical protein [Rhodothermales bacterium]
MSGNSDDGFATRVPPTVSKDKTLQLALTKLERGWVIILGPKGKNANLFKPGKGFDPILFSVAARMRDLGLIQEAGPHYMGTKYVLAEGADPKAIVKPAIVDDDDDLDADEDDSDYDDVESLDEVENDFESDDLQEEEDDESEPKDDDEE